MKKISAIILSLSIILFSPLSFAWTGYDYESKTQIEIEAGNLVRENLVIEFYDANSDNFHAAQVIFMESDAMGTKLTVKDLELKKERIFFMED